MMSRQMVCRIPGNQERLLYLIHMLTTSLPGLVPITAAKHDCAVRRDNAPPRDLFNLTKPLVLRAIYPGLEVRLTVGLDQNEEYIPE